MASEYKIRLKDHTGTVVDELSDQGQELRNLSFSHSVNNVGVCSLELDPNSRFVNLFEPDFQIEIFRRNPAMGLRSWLETPEWEGFGIDTDDSVRDAGNDSFKVTGVSYLDLIRRRRVLYPAETSFTNKTGKGETVIKSIVNENVGPAANSVTRKANGVTQGLTIEADGARGSTVSRKFSWVKPFDVIRDLALESGLYFDILGTGAGTFQFNMYANQRGIDHSNIGLSLATGLNASGYPPHIFSTGFQNMSNPRYVVSRMTEVNRVAVLGSGNESARRVEVRNNTTAQALSPWNIREETLQASQETTAASLQSLGNAFLLLNQAGAGIGFDVKQIRASAYGNHYSWGDRVVIQFKTLSFVKHLLGVKIDFAPGADEKIALEFGDVPA